MIPGEYILADGDIQANVGRATARVTVANTADRPIQVGSHFHFFEVNRALRFEPGEEKEVNLVALGGSRIVYGMNGLVMGSLDAPGAKEAALEKAKTEGYLEVQP
jgi:urease beta subunit